MGDKGSRNLTNRPYAARLSLEQRVARAVCFIVTLRRDENGRYRKYAKTLEQARDIARQMDAGRVGGESLATIRAISPEGARTAVPKNAV